jgi:hypothetical protein
MTKLRKETLAYAIDSKINKVRAVEAPLVAETFTVTQDRTKGSKALRTTMHYKKPIARSDYSFEDLMATLRRIEKLSTRPSVELVMVGVRF